MLVECDTCEARVDAVEVASYINPAPQLPFQLVYTLLKCPQCSEPLLVQNFDFGDGPTDPIRLYPETRILSSSIPRQLRLAYEEAVACLRAKAFTAAAIMCRKTIEGTCKQHGIQGVTLVGALKKLRENGVIENRLYEWADTLRIVSNEAAHDPNVTVSYQDARDLAEFTNAILEYLFTFRDKFEKFKARRLVKKGAP